MEKEIDKTIGADPTRPIGPGNPPAHSMFKPGQSGNPKGCPKNALRITDKLRKKVEDEDGKLGEAVATALIKGALKGDIRHIREILDRIDGRVSHEIEGPSGGLTFIVREATKKRDEEEDEG